MYEEIAIRTRSKMRTPLIMLTITRINKKSLDRSSVNIVITNRIIIKDPQNKLQSNLSRTIGNIVTRNNGEKISKTLKWYTGCAPILELALP